MYLDLNFRENEAFLYYILIKYDSKMLFTFSEEIINFEFLFEKKCFSKFSDNLNKTNKYLK